MTATTTTTTTTTTTDTQDIYAATDSETSATFDNSALYADPYEMADDEIEESHDVEMATASIASYVPEGTYVLCLTLLPAKTKAEVAEQNPELTPKEQWDKSDFYLDVKSGRPVKRRATYSVEVEIKYSVDEDKPMFKKYTQKFYVISRNEEGKTGYGNLVDGNVKAFARTCRIAWQAAYELTAAEMDEQIKEGNVTEQMLLDNLTNVYVTGKLTVSRRELGDRVFENNEFNSYTLAPVDPELAANLGG